MRRGAKAHERRTREVLFVAAILLVAMASRPAIAAVRRTSGMLSLDDLRNLAREVGFTGRAVDVAAAVAMAESLGNPNAANIVSAEEAAQRGQRPERSFGLWQVNVLAHEEYDEARLLDPTYCARAAFVLSKAGADWSAWTGSYTNGRYRKYMPEGVA